MDMEPAARRPRKGPSLSSHHSHPQLGGRNLHDGNSVRNLLDSGFEQGSALFSVKDLCNVLRALDKEDQRQFSFAMTRVLAH